MLCLLLLSTECLAPETDSFSRDALLALLLPAVLYCTRPASVAQLLLGVLLTPSPLATSLSASCKLVVWETVVILSSQLDWAQRCRKNFTFLLTPYIWVCLETLNTQRDSSKRGQS